MEIPKFKLTRVMSDGSEQEPQVLPLERFPLETTTNRRGFLGAGLTAFSLFATPKLLNGNISSRADIDVLKAHDSAIESLHFSNDGKTLISLAYNDLKIWSLPGRKLLGRVNESAIRCVAISPDNRTFAVANENELEIRSLKNGSLIKSNRKLETPTSIKKIVYSYDGTMLLSLLERSNQIMRWNCLTLNKEAFYPENFSDQIVNLFCTPDGKLLFTIESPSDSYNGRWLRIRSASNGELIKTLLDAPQEFNHNDVILFSKDGNRFHFINYKENLIRIWNMKELKQEYFYYRNTGKVFSISPDGLKMFTDFDGVVQIWEAPMISNVQKSILDMLAVPDYEELKKPIIDLCRHSGSINAIAISPIGSTIVSGDFSGCIKLSDWSKPECLGFIFDPRVNEEDGVSYNIYDQETGHTVSYTLPCGSQIPSGAVCTCNCVAGTKPVYIPPPTYQSSGSYCSCNKVCTCIPICQAHKLLHPDPFVRLLSREILFVMGIKEIEYMIWAANSSKPLLRASIESIINVIKLGVGPNYRCWPHISDCQSYLRHQDEVIAIMAAQMINMLHHLRKTILPETIHQEVDSLLVKSMEMDWRQKIRQEEALTTPLQEQPL